LRRPDSFYENDIINNLILQALPEQGDTSLDVPEPPRPKPPYGNPVLDPGAVLAQLGAFNSLSDAADGWARYTAQYPDLLGGLQRVITPIDAGGRVLYQLRAAGLDTVDQAGILCGALSARGVACLALTNN